MTRRKGGPQEFTELLGLLVATGESAPSLGRKIEIAGLARQQFPDRAAELDQHLLSQNTSLERGLLEAGETQQKLKELLDTLTATPWHLAIYLGSVTTPDGLAGVVMHGNERRAVGFAEGVSAADFGAGDEVFLSYQMNLIMEASGGRFFRVGETAVFERHTPDDRLLVSARGEEFIVDAVGSLEGTDLSAGDLVRCDRSVWMAFEHVERSAGDELFLDEAPDQTFADIGGLDQKIATLMEPIRLQMFHREIMERYKLAPAQSLLLTGAPGVGKTMIARALANWLADASGVESSTFMNIKPAGLHSSWYGKTESNYREVFRVARERSVAHPGVPVVMFFDEVDAIGSERGRSLTPIDDRVLAAFMVELNGLRERGNVLVMAATNRPDTMDPALLRPGRLCDLVLDVPRPGRDAAREIFDKHLDPDVPYQLAEPGEDASQPRERIIDAVVARMYAATDDGEIGTLILRDGARRTVHARELMSGAAIANVCQVASRKAGWREAGTGEAGIRMEDLLEAAVDEIDKAARVLTPANCAGHLSNLPDDVDVVRVELIDRKVRSPHRYLSVA